MVCNFLTTYVCETGNVTANSSRYAKRRTLIESISGDMPDITKYMDFSFNSFVTYKVILVYITRDWTMVGCVTPSGA